MPEKLRLPVPAEVIAEYGYDDIAKRNAEIQALKAERNGLAVKMDEFRKMVNRIATTEYKDALVERVWKRASEEIEEIVGFGIGDYRSILATRDRERDAAVIERCMDCVTLDGNPAIALKKMKDLRDLTRKGELL